jgi:hypothetical protein
MRSVQEIACLMNEVSTAEIGGKMRTRIKPVLVAVVALTSLFAAPMAAEGTPSNSNVTLKGRALCGGKPATWVWVEASNGEHGWATQPGGNYEFRFHHVPTSTLQVTVKLGITGWECKPAKFGVNRPAIGTSATRHVNQLY